MLALKVPFKFENSRFLVFIKSPNFMPNNIQDGFVNNNGD